MSASTMSGAVLAKRRPTTKSPGAHSSPAKNKSELHTAIKKKKNRVTISSPLPRGEGVFLPRFCCLDLLAAPADVQ